MKYGVFVKDRFCVVRETTDNNNNIIQIRDFLEKFVCLMCGVI